MQGIAVNGNFSDTYQFLGRLVFTWFFDFHRNLGNVLSSFIIFPPVHWLKKSDYPLAEEIRLF